MEKKDFKILFLDDEIFENYDNPATMAKEEIEDAGYSIDVTNKMSEVINAYHKKYYHLYLLDIDMGKDETNISYQDILKNASVITTQAMPLGLIQKIVVRIHNTIDGCESTIEKNPDSQNAINAKKALKNNQRILERRQGKILDGLDSLIVVFAFEYAKKYKDNEIRIISDDKFMVVHHFVSSWPPF